MHMTKIIVLSILFLVLVLPLFFYDSLTTFTPITRRDDDDDDPPPVKRRSSRRWEGPRTDPWINTILSKSIVTLKSLGVPISDSIAPEVTLIKVRSFYARCCSKGSSPKYTEYDYYIDVSGYIVNNTDRSLQNTIYHELLHTIPGADGHTGVWKKWAKYVNEKTGYHISC